MSIEKKTYRSGPWKDVFAQGVRVGDRLYLAGQVSMDESGAVVGAGDIAAQVRTTYGNIARVLGQFGATMENVVDETLFVTDMAMVMDNLEAVGGARAEAYGGTAEVSQTMVQVAGLVMPELLIEIKCVAQL
ncbi:MAG: RidA family protein [Sandaracinaceae bacterium]|nr:hypothetical protein [Myxococcales bacterium]